MRTFGLIGYPLKHSFSKIYFEKKWSLLNLSTEYYYNLYSLKNLGHFAQLIENDTSISGLNVTIPYKIEIMQFMNYIDPEASVVGAVNTIRLERKNGKSILSGYNTDIFGFEKVLFKLLKKSRNSGIKALILGTGGASKAVDYVLNKAGIEFMYVSRKAFNKNKTIEYGSVNNKILKEYRLIINTSPLGMYPETDKLPDIPYHLITEHHILFDLIYNPPLTNFLLKGKEKGALICNGYEMLCLQAEKSWEIWNYK